MVRTIVALCFEVFTVNSMGDDSVMCFKSMDESNLRITIAVQNDTAYQILTSFNVSLSKVSADLQNAIRTATRMNGALNGLISKNADVIAKFKKSGNRISSLFVENRRLEGQIDMLSADLIKLESNTIIPGLRSIGIDITDNIDSVLDAEFSIYYTDDHGMPYKK